MSSEEANPYLIVQGDAYGGKFRVEVECDADEGTLAVELRDKVAADGGTRSEEVE